MEGDGARVARSIGGAPCDPLVGKLFNDLGLPLPANAADFRDPVQVRVVDLGDRLDPFHERRELLELRPLVVRRSHGHVHLDGFFDCVIKCLQ